VVCRYLGDRYLGDRYRGDRYRGDRYLGDRATFSAVCSWNLPPRAARCDARCWRSACAG